MCPFCRPPARLGVHRRGRRRRRKFSYDRLGLKLEPKVETSGLRGVHSYNSEALKLLSKLGSTYVCPTFLRVHPYGRRVFHRHLRDEKGGFQATLCRIHYWFHKNTPYKVFNFPLYNEVEEDLRIWSFRLLYYTGAVRDGPRPKRRRSTSTSMTTSDSCGSEGYSEPGSSDCSDYF